MVENDSRIRGSCLCRGIAYAATSPLGPMWHCHCLICRKLSGAAFATYVEAQVSGFSWLRGQELLAHYALSATLVRSFCHQCGSVVPYATSDGMRMVLPAGGLDDDPGVRPCAHIGVATQAPWHSITDALPRFATAPPHLTGCPPPPPRPQIGPRETGGGHGSCLCGRVIYTVRGPLEVIKNCHCWRDRKMTGAPHDSCLLATASGVHWLQGEPLVVVYSLPETPGFRTGFCRVCGTSLPARVPNVTTLGVPAGALDNDPGARARFHIFCGTKAPWFEITDNLPQFVEHPPPDFDWR